MDNKTDFKPYVSAEKITPELTVTSIIMGILLAVIFGAANAYLGLRVGMTVSASIPAAVIWFKPSALPVNRWRRAQSLPCLHFSYGQARAKWTSQIF